MAKTQAGARLGGAEGYEAQSAALAPGASGYDAQSAALSPTNKETGGALNTQEGGASKQPPAPRPKDEVAPVAGSDLVLSRDPAYAKESFKGWFAQEVGAKITSWGLSYDRTRVHLARVGDTSTKVMALKWDTAWGAKPANEPSDFTMKPIDAKASVTGVHALAGWGSVPSGDQGILDSLLGGETNGLSAAARGSLRGKFSGLTAQTKTQQAGVLQGIIGAKDAVPELVGESVETAATTFTLSAAVEKKGYAFRGRVADAECFTASFSDGTSVDIIAPKAPVPGYHQHSVAEAADAASHLPKENRKTVNTVVLNVVENPDDAYWAVQYNTPGFHSYMTAGKSGVVMIYPDRVVASPDAQERRGAMIHETGHTWSFQKWGEDTTKGKWVDWKTAMGKDKASVSGYAMNAISEDVAETVRVYGSTKGTPKYKEYKEIIPNRLTILETELG